MCRDVFQRGESKERYLNSGIINTSLLFEKREFDQVALIAKVNKEGKGIAQGQGPLFISILHSRIQIQVLKGLWNQRKKRLFL